MKLNLVKNEKVKLVICIVVIFLILFIFQEIKNITDFFWDSALYMELSNSLISDGKLDFNTYTRSYRGYILPFLLLPCNMMSSLISVFLAYRIYSSIIFALFLGLLFPYFIEKLLKVKIGIMKRIIFALIVIVFWNGLIMHPLSDLWSVLFLIIAILCIILLKESNKFWKNLLYALICGISIYCMYNIRTIYMFSILPILALFFINITKMKAMKIYKKILLIVILVIGAVIVAYPQCIINRHHYESFTPTVVTKGIYKKSLIVFQLGNGLYYNRYETNINLNDYPSAAMKYINKQGKELAEEYNNISSMKDYVSAAIKEPFTIISVYFAHFISGLDIKYPNIYVERVSGIGVTAISLLNYTMLYYFIVGLKNQFEFKNINKKNYDIILVLITTILPVIAILPGAIEARFFIPLYLLIYSYAIFAIDHKKMLETLKKNWKIYTISYILFIIILYSINELIIGTLV